MRRRLQQALTVDGGTASGARVLATAAFLSQAAPLAILAGAVRLAGVLPTRDLPLALLVLPPLLAQALAWFLARRAVTPRAQSALLLVAGPVTAAAVAAVSLAVEPALGDALLLGLLSLVLLLVVLLAA